MASIGEQLGDIEGFASRAEHAVADELRRLTHPHLFRHDADTRAPASTPASLEPQPQKENPMSLVSDVEQGYQAVKNELGRFDQALPGLLERAKAFEASPFAAIAEKAASAVLPPEAVAIAVKAADTVINDLVALYATPAQAEPAAPAPAQ